MSYNHNDSHSESERRNAINILTIQLAFALKKGERITINDCGCYGIITNNKPEFVYCEKHESIKK